MGKLAICFALAASGALAASDEAAIQSTFVRPWIEALRAKDKAKIEQLYHPALRACINPATREFFDYELEGEVFSPAVGDYRITKLGPMQQPAPTFWPKEYVSYPVLPTYEVQVQFDAVNTVFVRFLAPSNGSWFEVFPCPNEKGLAYFREQKTERDKQEKKVARLLEELKDPLKSELRGLIRQQKKIDAVDKYRAATGADLTIATLLINALEKSDR
jgi:hypothetical protein